MVPVLDPSLVERDEEQVRALNVGQLRCRVRDLEHGIAERRRQAVEDGGAKEELTHVRSDRAEERLTVDNAGNANGVVCSYIGKNPLPKGKAAIVDDREFVKK